jgi:putative flippase GtrA
MRDMVQSSFRSRAILRYLVVGVAANGLGLTIFQALVLLGFAPELSSALSFFPAFLTAYAMNRSWSFESKVRHADGILRYAIVNGINILLTVAIVAFLHRVLDIYPLISQIVALGIATPLSYNLMRYWVFHV